MTPFRADKNLGKAYNEAMDILPADAWAVFLDHDACFTTPHWHAQLTEAIAFKPDAGAIVAVTNRIASSWQRAGDPRSNDIAAHRKFGAERVKVRTLLDISATRGWGGVCFAVSKAAWQECGGFAEAFYCVDHSLHYGLRRIGRKVWLHEGLYLFHMRASSGAHPPLDAPKWSACPCRSMPETMPGVRVALP